MTVSLANPNGGPLSLRLTRDNEGYREYVSTMRFTCTTVLDGPQQVLAYIESGASPTVPNPGDTWAVGNDLDDWVWCKWDLNIRGVGELPFKNYDVDFTFTNKPDQRCQDYKIENPLAEPQKVSGNFNRFTEEAFYDKEGQPLLNSAFEQIRGQQVEFDRNRPVVKIEQNVANLELNLLASMIDCVNAYDLWGFPPRTIKFSACTWEKIYYGACLVYYKRVLEFEVNMVARPTPVGTSTVVDSSQYDTWDREVIDEGTKVLNGHFHRNGHFVLDDIDGQPPNPRNPQHFIRYQDRNGNNTRVILNGAGLPAGVLLGSGSGYTYQSGCRACTNLPETWSVYIDLTAIDETIKTFSLEFDMSRWNETDGYYECIWRFFDNFPSRPELWTYLRAELVYNKLTNSLSFSLEGFEGVMNILDSEATTTQLCASTPNSVSYNVRFHCTSVPGVNVVVTLTRGSPGALIPPGAETEIGKKLIQKYYEADFLLLGIPTSF